MKLHRILLAAVAMLSAAPAVGQIVSRDDAPGVPAVLTYVTADGRRVTIQVTANVDPTTGNVIGTSAQPMVVSGNVTSNTRTTAAGTSDAQAYPVQGVTGGVPQNVNNTQINGAAISTGTGASNSGAQRVVLASDSPLAPNAATSGNQQTQITAEQAIQANLTNGNQQSQQLCRVAQTTPSIGSDGTMKVLQCTPTGALQIGGFSTAAIDLTSSNAIFLWGPDGNIRPLAGIGYYTSASGNGLIEVRGDVAGAWVHGPQSTPAAQGSSVAAGGTLAVAFVNTADTEVVNPSGTTFWCSWGTPAANAAGSYPILANGSYRPPNRPAGTFTCLNPSASAANLTVTRF